MAKSANSSLTDKQDRFCQEYVVDFNATQAAIRAGYSKKGAEVTGSQLLRNPKVSEKIATLKNGLEWETVVSKLDIVNGIFNIAKHGDLEKNRLNAWGMLAKMNGMFVDKTEAETNYTGTITVTYSE